MANFQDIIKKIDTDLPDNNQQEITARRLRNVLKDMVYKQEESLDFLDEGSYGEVLTRTQDGVEWKDVVGYQGIEGSQGVQGKIGIQGNQGDRGIQGHQGVQGTLGKQGYQGERGLDGKQGKDGVQGAIGNPGSRGYQGVQGTLGVQGKQGVQGTLGKQGYQGERGERGKDGEIGKEGVQGVQGSIGVQGVQGELGDIGKQGLQGSIGVQGFQGEQGNQGRIGGGVLVKGSMEECLTPGDSYIGEDGHVYILQSTDDARVFIDGGEVRGPQGLQGERGAVGPAGNTGQSGERGLQGNQGNQGVQGPIGGGVLVKASKAECSKPGDSYIGDDGHIYILKSFDDEQIFIDGGEIKGPQGVQGQRGEKGEPGNGSDVDLSEIESKIDGLQTELNSVDKIVESLQDDVYAHDEAIKGVQNLNIRNGEGTCAILQKTDSSVGKNDAQGNYASAFGAGNEAYCYAEHVVGRFNKTTGGWSAIGWYGDNINNVFSVGNGADHNQRHNAFEVKQDGTIFIANVSEEKYSYYERPMINLQNTLDSLQNQINQGGGGGSTIDLPLQKGSGENSIYQNGNSSPFGRNTSLFGIGNEVYNYAEHVVGQYNKPLGAYWDGERWYGDNIHNVFSIGNGEDGKNQHNAIEVRQDGTIYIADVLEGSKYYEVPMMNLQETIKNLQDQINNGGGGTGPTDKWVKSVMQEGGYIRVANSSGTVDEINFKTINGQSIFGTDNIKIGGGDDVFERGDSGENSVQVIGCHANGDYAFAIGRGCNATGMGAFAVNQSGANADFAAAFGLNNNCQAYIGAVFGEGNTPKAKYEFICGSHSIQRDPKDPWEFTGSPDDSVFRVGNGNWDREHHDAFDIRQDGSIYVVDVYTPQDFDKKPMLKLQDITSKKWIGREYEYTQLGSYDPYTFYYIIEE